MHIGVQLLFTKKKSFSSWKTMLVLKHRNKNQKPFSSILFIENYGEKWLMDFRASNERLLKDRDERRKLQLEISKFEAQIELEKDKAKGKFSDFLNNPKNAKIGKKNSSIRDEMFDKKSLLGKITLEIEQLKEERKRKEKDNNYKLAMIKESVKFAEAKAKSDKERDETFGSREKLQTKIEKMKTKNEELKKEVLELENTCKSKADELERTEQNLEDRKQRKESIISMNNSLKDQIKSTEIAKQESRAAINDKKMKKDSDLEAAEMKLEKVTKEKEKLYSEVKELESTKEEMNYNLSFVSAELKRAMMTADKYRLGSQ